MNLRTKLWEKLTPPDVRAEMKQLLETLNTAVETRMAEPGWSVLGEGSTELRGVDARTRNKQAYELYHTDPVARQAVQLHNAYTFGRGISFDTTSEPIKKILQRFWDDVRNRESLTRVRAQYRLNRDSQLQGSITLLLSVSTIDGRVTVKQLPQDQIKQVIYLEEDSILPAYYKRVYNPRTYDFETGTYRTGAAITSYVPDYRHAEPDWSLVKDLPDNTELYLMHIVTNEANGVPLTHLSPAIPWLYALKGFMEDRVTLNFAWATFAFVAKIAGNRKALQELQARWGEYEGPLKFGVGDGRYTRQGGNVLWANQQFNLEQFKTETGASNAYQDVRMLRQMAGIGAGGIFEHYLGDPSTGNLATATAMELPMLKLFEYEQQSWEEIVSDILDFVVVQAIRFQQIDGTVEVDRAMGLPVWQVNTGEDVSVDVIFPNIVQSDVNVWAQAIAAIKMAEQTSGKMILPPRETALTVLRILGFNDDVVQILGEMEAKDFELDKKSNPVPPALAPFMGMNQDAGDGGEEEEEDEGDEDEDAEEEPVEEVDAVIRGKAPSRDKVHHLKPITQSELMRAFEEWVKAKTAEDLL